MRRILLVLAISAMLVAMLGASAVPVIADDLGDLDSGVFDDDDDGDDGLFDGGGPICPDEDEQPELIVCFGFVCVDADDHHDVIH